MLQSKPIKLIFKNVTGPSAQYESGCTQALMPLEAPAQNTVAFRHWEL